MLQAQHNGNTYDVSSFKAPIEEISELASNVYKKVNGWEPMGTLTGFTADETLEIIDRIRIPLAGKKFDGQRLSLKEESYLTMMETLTDKILNSIAPVPEESPEVRSAMLHAKRLLQGI